MPKGDWQSADTDNIGARIVAFVCVVFLYFSLHTLFLYLYCFVVCIIISEGLCVCVHLPFSLSRLTVNNWLLSQRAYTCQLLLCSCSPWLCTQFSSEGPSDDEFVEETGQSTDRYCSVSLIIGSWKHGRGKAFLIVCAHWDCRRCVCDWNNKKKVGLFWEYLLYGQKLFLLFTSYFTYNQTAHTGDII